MADPRRRRSGPVVDATLDRSREASDGQAMASVPVGDGAMVRLLTSRLMPAAKARPFQLALPSLVTLADVARAQAAVVAAVADGAITSDEGLAVTALIAATGKAFDAADVEQRIAALESRLGEPQRRHRA